MTRDMPVPIDVMLMNRTASALFIVFAALVVGAVLGWAWRHPLFAISHIAVTGDITHSNAMTLRTHVVPQLSGTFFTMDLARTRLAFEAAPWVRQAVVHRAFPNQLNVQLQEHQAAAYWGAESESKLVNNFGEVFEANVGEVEQEALPRLSGPEGQAAQVLTMYQTLQSQFKPTTLALEQFELNGHGGWRARLNTDALIEFGGGSPAEVLARTQQFLQTLAQVTARYGRTPQALETADLRHQDGYAIRLRGVTTLVLDSSKK